jgi:hypothetical protein
VRSVSLFFLRRRISEELLVFHHEFPSRARRIFFSEMCEKQVLAESDHVYVHVSKEALFIL